MMSEARPVPKLRFPEFLDVRDWEEKPLRDVVHFLDGRRKPIKEADRTAIQGNYPYYGASGIIDYINDYIFDEDLILLGEDGENIVSRNLPLVFKVSGRCWVNNHAHVMKPKAPNHLEFLVQYMESLSYIKYNSGGAQPKLNQAVCKTIPLLLPTPPEQQKIAECLTSIDDLITAETQNLNALKTHKKGLMQKLFPADDETMPKLRFPRFQDKNPWQVKQLFEVANVIAGQSPEGSSYNGERIGVPFYQGKTNFGDIYLKEPTTWTTQTTKLAKEGDILMSVRAPVGALNISTGEICIGRGVASIQAKQNKWYIYYFLKKNEKYIVGNGGSIFDSINKKQIEEIKILIPSLPEQQKIAECLTSINDLIMAQAQKLDALKTHKKGLMQQLFPTSDEVKV